MAIGVNNTNSLVPQGSALVQTAVARVLLEPLRQASVLLSSGVNIIDSASPVQLPIAPALNENLGFVAEGGTIPQVSPQFGAKTLLPSTMQSIKIISVYTNELFRQSVVSIDAALQSQLVESVAATLDNNLIAGTGDGITTPQGILNYGGIQTLDLANTDPTVDKLYDALSLALGANVPQSELRWWLHHDTYIKLLKQKDTSGQYLLQPDATQAGRLTLLGIPVTVTDRFPVATSKTSALLFSPSRITVVRDVNPKVDILREFFANTDEVGIRVVSRVDAGTAFPASIVKLTNVKVG